MRGYGVGTILRQVLLWPLGRFIANQWGAERSDVGSALIWRHVAPHSPLIALRSPLESLTTKPLWETTLPPSLCLAPTLKSPQTRSPPMQQLRVKPICLHITACVRAALICPPATPPRHKSLAAHDTLPAPSCPPGLSDRVAKSHFCLSLFSSPF